MAERVAGKVALITGAARSQGRTHAVRLAEEGADLIAVDLCDGLSTTAYEGASEEDLAETVAQVEKLGRRVVSAKADVRDFEELTAAVDDGVAQLGRLDIVSANAGILSFGPLADMDEATWQQMLDINLTGVWHTAKAAAPHLGEGGSITITSSIAGLQGMPGIGNYVSAKHGVVGLMRTLALELGERGIRVNTIHPTQVNTAMITHEDMYKMFRPDLESPTFEDFKEASQSTHILATPWLEPIDVSNALLFLASEEARYITGAALPVDAGALTK